MFAEIKLFSIAMPTALSSAAKTLLVSLTLPLAITITVAPVGMAQLASPNISSQPTGN
jgi:hypothetical protein